MTELKLCPFCGEVPILAGSDEGNPYWFVMCDNCGATVLGSADKNKAVESWNRRANGDKI